MEPGQLLGGHLQPSYSFAISVFSKLLALSEQRKAALRVPLSCQVDAEAQSAAGRGDRWLQEGRTMTTSDKQGADFTC